MNHVYATKAGMTAFPTVEEHIRSAGKYRFLILFILSILVVPVPVYSGTLQDFESSVNSSDKTKKENRKSSKSDSDSSDHEYDSKESGDSDEGSDFFSELFFELTRVALEIGTMTTIERTSDYSSGMGVDKRKRGSELLPTFRVSGNWQNIDRNLSARDFSIDVGYSLVAMEIRRTRYSDSSAGESLNLNYELLKYRMSYGSSFELDFGIGRAQLVGSNHSTGTTISFPMIWEVYPDTYARFRIDFTSFSKTSITDCDLAASYSFGYGVAASVGYRSVSSPASSLSGPYAGLSYIY